MVWGAEGEIFQKKERCFRRLQRGTMIFSSNHICRFVQPCCTLLLQAAWQHAKLPSLWQFPALTHFPSLTQRHQWSQTQRASCLQHFDGQGKEHPPSGEAMEVWGLPRSGEWCVESPVIALDHGQWRLRHCRLLGLRFWNTWVRWRSGISEYPGETIMLELAP